MKAEKTVQMCSLTRTSDALTHKEEMQMEAQVKFKLEQLYKYVISTKDL